jgi:hypothetical protein
MKPLKIATGKIPAGRGPDRLRPAPSVLKEIYRAARMTYNPRMKRLAILTADENIWSLGCWSRALPVLQAAGYEVAGLWTVAPVPQGQDAYGRYIAAFGRWTFFKLGLFGIFTRVFQLAGLKPLSLRALCRRRGVFYGAAEDPNDPQIAAWLKEQGVETVLIQVPHIIKPPLIAQVAGGIVNHHAGLLPANRGIYPYFWAVLNGSPQGVSFHLVTEKIDAGALLYQEMVMEPEALASMTVFEVNALRAYPEGILAALSNLAHKMIQPPPGVTESYHSFPAREDYRKFLEQAGHILRLRDVVIQAARLVF